MSLSLELWLQQRYIIPVETMQVNGEGIPEREKGVKWENKFGLRRSIEQKLSTFSLPSYAMKHLQGRKINVK